MVNRTVQEITFDLKKSMTKLLVATMKAEEAEKERTIAIVELLNLQKELGRMTDGRDTPDSHIL